MSGIESAKDNRVGMNRDKISFCFKSRSFLYYDILFFLFFALLIAKFQEVISFPKNLGLYPHYIHALICMANAKCRKKFKKKGGGV